MKDSVQYILLSRPPRAFIIRLSDQEATKCWRPSLMATRMNIYNSSSENIFLSSQDAETRSNCIKRAMSISTSFYPHWVDLRQYCVRMPGGRWSACLDRLHTSITSFRYTPTSTWTLSWASKCFARRECTDIMLCPPTPIKLEVWRRISTHRAHCINSIDQSK